MISDEQPSLASLRASLIPSVVSAPGLKLTNLSSTLLGQRVINFA
ncbi:MAG: hypothetical protein ABF744_01440 [Liquorilactobacillus hordei]